MAEEKNSLSFRKKLAVEDLEILDLFTTSFSLFRLNFMTFFLLSMICGIPIVISTVYFPLPTFDPLAFKTLEDFLSWFKKDVTAGFYINNILSIVLDVISTIAVSLIVEAMIYKKRPQVSWALYGSIFLLFPALVTIILAMVITSFGFVLLIIPGIIISIMFMFSINVCSLRHTWGINAIRYSMTLVKEKFFRAFFVVMFIFLFENSILLSFSSASIDTREGLLYYFLSMIIYYPFNTYFKIVVALFFLNRDYIHNERSFDRLA